jgi:hypothetical protein
LLSTGGIMNIEKVKKLLEKIEWVYNSDYDVKKCPCCENVLWNGHKDNCELQEVINELKSQ